MKQDKKLTGVRLTDDAKEKLVHLASLDERSQSYVVEKLILEKFKQLEDK